MTKKILALLAMLAAPLPAFAVSATQTLINTTGLAFSTSTSQNLLQFGSPQGIATKLSAQVTWSSATIANQTFTGGQASTASITIVSTQSLISAQATDTLVVPSTASILGSPATGYITVISVNGLLGSTASFTTTLANFAQIQASSPTIALNGSLYYTYGGNWTSTDTIVHACSTLANAINAGGTFSATVISASTQVVITSIQPGASLNGLAVTSSSAPLVSTGTFSGGRDPVKVTIGNTFQSFVFTYGQNWASTDTVSHAAAELATLITTIGDVPTNQSIGGIVANSVAGVVYSTAEVNGTYGNNFTMATSSAALVSVSAANFSGGLNRSLLNSYFSVGGMTYHNGKHWTDSSNTSTGTIASIISFVNGVSTATATCGQGLGNLVASWTGPQTIKMTEQIPCSGGNALTLAVSAGSGLSVGSANFSGGQDNASFTINGKTLSYPTDWNLGASSTTTTTANSIASAINSNSVTKLIVAAANAANVVRATSTANGLASNYSLTTSTVALTAVGFTGGLDTNYSSGSATIGITSHGFTLDLPVLYTADAGKAITGLTNQTTYYVVPVDSNSFKLASSSANALSNTTIVLGSTDTTTSKHTYTLAPLGFVQGPAGAFWQVSNDGTNWSTYSTTSNNVAVATYTFSAAIGGTSQAQDFGPINFSFIRLNQTGPTQGALVLKAVLATKD